MSNSLNQGVEASLMGGPPNVRLQPRRAHIEGPRLRMLASQPVFRIPARRRHVHLQYDLKSAMCSSTSSSDAPLDRPRRYTSPVDGAENDVLRVLNTDHRPEQVVEFGFLNHERVASKAEPARLAEQDQAEVLDVNHQRKFPEVGLCFTPRAFRKSGVGMRIQNEGVSRCQSAEPTRLVFFPSHRQIGTSQRGGLEKSAWSSRRASLRPVSVNTTDLAFPRGAEMNPLSCSRFIVSQSKPFQARWPS